MNKKNKEEAQEAQWLQENRLAIENDLEESPDTDFTIAKPLSVSTSFRMSLEEAAVIREAAQRAGMSVSEWIRTVSITAAKAPQPHIRALGALRETLNKLYKVRDAETEFIKRAESILAESAS